MSLIDISKLTNEEITEIKKVYEHSERMEHASWLSPNDRYMAYERCALMEYIFGEDLFKR